MSDKAPTPRKRTSRKRATKAAGTATVPDPLAEARAYAVSGRLLPAGECAKLQLRVLLAIHDSITGKG